MNDYESSIPRPAVRKPRTWLYVWLLVFAANLPIPLYFAVPIVKDGGYWGTAVSLLILWFAGQLACYHSPFFTKRILIGGAIVGAFQFWPLPQIMAGAIGLAVAGINFEEALSDTTPVSEWQGFIATFVTGGLLMTAATIMGAFVVAICEVVMGPQQTPVERSAGSRDPHHGGE